MAAKRFKLKFSLPSFQFCRSKRPSSYPPTTYFFSPVNPKSFEISYPTFPDPPPSTPNQSSSKIIPLNSQTIHDSPTSETKNHSKSKSNLANSDAESPITLPKSENRSSSKIIPFNAQKMHNSPISIDLDRKSAITQPKSENKNKSKSKSKSKSKVCASISSGDSVWFSSEDEKETESLFSSSTSLDSSLETINESPGYENRRNANKRKSNKKKKSGNLRVRRLKRYVSNGWKTMVTSSESEKVKESFAVVKRSEDPYEDFKRSMLEMILEKQMFEAKDLEELLQCFLSLNSREHHAVIVQAFTEIWEDLFL